jgi:hypothetical protein
MIVQSVRHNAKAEVDVQSDPDKGMAVTISFRRQDATDL